MLYYTNYKILIKLSPRVGRLVRTELFGSVRFGSVFMPNTEPNFPIA